MPKRKPLKQWRSVLCVQYHGIDALSYYRVPILAILKNVALLKGIECAIVCGGGAWKAGRSLLSIDPQELEPDYIHFRSEKRPLISRVEFEKLVLPLLPSLLEGVLIEPLYQYEVREMPFPVESDMPPFVYGLS